jgi:hypothetical protein
MVEGAIELAPSASDDTAILGKAALTPEDFKGVWWHLRHVRLALLRAALAMLACILVLYRASESTAPIPVAICTAILASALVGLLLYRGRSRWALTATEQLRGGAVEYRLDQQSIATRSPGTEARVDWSNVHRFVEAPSAFLVYTSPAYAVIMPKRAFAESDVQALRNLLAQRIAPRPKEPLVARRTIGLWVVLILGFLAIWQTIGKR